MDKTPLRPQNTNNHSIYIHFPFCVQRCTYCDFNTFAHHENLIPAYVEALCTEIVKVSNLANILPPVHTIFFGGGTPTLLTPQQLEKILNTIQIQFPLRHNMEITMEGNPGTITFDSLKAYHSAGVNRLSFGVQTVHADELKLLGRIHDHKTTVEGMGLARKAGFENINLDLIYGLPYQSVSRWQQTLAEILTLSPDHLSIYALKVEENTPLYHSVQRGDIPLPDEDLAAEMYDFAMDFLDNHGFIHYEISNWGRQYENDYLHSQHNMQYWKNQPYFGFGAGAHSLLNDIRLVNENQIQNYIDACLDKETIQYPLSPATVKYHKRSKTEALEDHIILALRLIRDGLNLKEINQRFCIDFETKFNQQISKLKQLELIEWTDQKKHLILTRKGRLLGNQVFMEFLDISE